MPDTLREAVPAACMQVLMHLWDYLDNTLEPSVAEALRAHLAECSACFEYQQFQERYRDAMRLARVSAQGAPWDVRARVMSTLAAARRHPLP